MSFFIKTETVKNNGLFLYKLYRKYERNGVKLLTWLERIIRDIDFYSACFKIS